VRKLVGGNITATWGPVTLHYGRLDYHATAHSAADELVAAVAEAGYTSLADWLSNDDKASSFTDFGLSVDWHNVLLQGEFAQSIPGGFIADTRGRYVLLGYRIHKLTPYAMYAQRNPISPTTDNTIPQTGPLQPLALGVDALLAAHKQHTSTF